MTCREYKQPYKQLYEQLHEQLYEQLYEQLHEQLHEHALRKGRIGYERGASAARRTRDPKQFSIDDGSERRGH